LRYAILGANGQLGQAFMRILGTEAVGLRRPQMELTKPVELCTLLTKLVPDVVLNCTAYNQVDKAESEPEAAFAVNAWGVRDLAKICRDLDCVFVHYSTNFVFGLDRQRQTPLNEIDLPGPESVYAASKLAGEYLARSVWAKHFVIRTCGLFGLIAPEETRRNFVEIMLHLAKQGKPVRVVNDQICSPTRADDLATATLRLLATEEFGLYHLTSAGECTWHEFARTIFELAGIKADLQAISSAEYGAAAKRPAYSVLSNAAYNHLGLEAMPDWKVSLSTYLRDRSAGSAKG
jgi:dTDP-4-dehydrorhamnose reductase